MSEPGEARQKRRDQRIQLEVEVIVRTDSAFLLPGRTHDISESGMSAILPVELGEGQEVELQIRFPKATVNTARDCRHRNVYRHGFEFEQPLRGIFGNHVMADGREGTLTFRSEPRNSPAELIHLPHSDEQRNLVRQEWRTG